MAFQHRDWSGRVALVTGGASGIGFAAYQLLNATGAQVVVADINAEAARAASVELGTSHSAALTLDVCDPESVDRAFAEIGRRFGRLDVLIHCAGIGIERTFLETSIAE